MFLKYQLEKNSYNIVVRMYFILQTYPGIHMLTTVKGVFSSGHRQTKSPRQSRRLGVRLLTGGCAAVWRQTAPDGQTESLTDPAHTAIDTDFTLTRSQRHAFSSVHPCLMHPVDGALVSTLILAPADGVTGGNCSAAVPTCRHSRPIWLREADTAKR